MTILLKSSFRARPPRNASFALRLALLLATVLALLVNAPTPAFADESQPPDPKQQLQLQQRDWGSSDLGRLILLYRTNHRNVLSSRNVAVFEYTLVDGTRVALAGASIGTTGTVVVDRFVNGVFDKSIPVTAMPLTRDGQPYEKPVNLHSEELLFLALLQEAKSEGLTELVTRGESEREPCFRCSKFLDMAWFPDLRIMNYNEAYGHSMEQNAIANANLKKIVVAWKVSNRPLLNGQVLRTDSVSERGALPSILAGDTAPAVDAPPDADGSAPAGRAGSAGGSAPAGGAAPGGGGAAPAGGAGSAGGSAPAGGSAAGGVAPAGGAASGGAAPAAQAGSGGSAQAGGAAPAGGDGSGSSAPGGAAPDGAPSGGAASDDGGAASVANGALDDAAGPEDAAPAAGGGAPLGVAPMGGAAPDRGAVPGGSAPPGPERGGVKAYAVGGGSESAVGSEPGGIDFSTLQLRYLSDTHPGDASGLRYAFSARAGGQSDLVAGRLAALQSSDAFFVWLALSPDKFWVNLNPSEPNRILDPQLAGTDAGRVMLQSDLLMKRIAAQLIRPDTPLGTQFWQQLTYSQDGTRCVNSRMWVVPAPATVRQDNDSLYIVEAPLDVKLDKIDLQIPGHPERGHCPATIEEHNEQVFRTLILPKVKDAVNTQPGFTELRRIYLSRVAAEWYRQRTTHEATNYGYLINRDDVGQWPARTQWSKQQVFDQYMSSVTNGEWKRVERAPGKTYSYFAGGVDFSHVPFNDVGSDTFQQNWGNLPQVVNTSLNRPIADGRGSLWIGSPTGAIPQPPYGPLPDVEFFGSLFLVLPALGIAHYRYRRRLRASESLALLGPPLDGKSPNNYVAASHSGEQRKTRSKVSINMIVLGSILLIAGSILNTSVLWTVGSLLLFIGAVWFIAASIGRAGGRH
jgi:hypothetical protein